MNKHPDTAISAGHGEDSRVSGKTDTGANIVGSSLDEDDITLNFSKRLVQDLRVLYGRRGRVMLRNSGKYYRADDDAANWGADLFIEIHVNSGGGTGTEVYYRAGASSNTAAFASNVSSSVATAYGLRNRGAKSANFSVLAAHRGMQSILLELFFGDSKKDVAAHRLNYTKAELALLNNILGHYGWKKVKSLPRTWGRVRRAAYRPY